MDRPKITQNMMSGVAVSMGPGVKWSQSARCPSWKIHTSAP